MTENELAKQIVNACYQIHVGLDPGLLESVYEEILSFELLGLGLHIERQRGLPVVWKELNMNLGFRADLVVKIKLL